MPDRDDAMTRDANYFDSGEFESDLARWVAIPSESQTLEGLPHCARYLAEEMAPAFEAMGSIERTSGRRSAIIPRMGGSICNDVLTDILGLPSIRIPHSCTACLRHAPDEHLLLSFCREAPGLMAGVCRDLGGPDGEERIP